VLEEAVQRHEARHTFQPPEVVCHQHRHHGQRSQPSRSKPREPVEDNAQGAGYLHENRQCSPEPPRVEADVNLLSARRIEMQQLGDAANEVC
jgi:hypothetical protein